MEELMEMLECIEDKRQQSKVRYPIKEIVLIVFSCTISNVDDLEDMEIWANHYIDLLREYLPYENGIPSHDTIQRVMGMIDPAYIQQAYNKWTSLLEKAEKEKLKKIIAIDGKTMRGNTKNLIILCLRGIVKTDIAWGSRESMKKVMKSQQYRSCLIK